MAARRKATPCSAMAIVVATVCLYSAMAASAQQTDCSTQFNAMQPCIEFINKKDAAPPSTQCCSAFKATELNTPVCLCQLQQAFADPVSAPGNVTRANQIPSLCAVAVDPSRCPALLGVVAPNVAPVVAPAVPRVVAPAVAPVAPIADIDCSPEFNSLATCIAYVSSNDTTPPAVCCSSLLNVHLKRPVCLCQLLQEVNTDPSQSSGLNVTKALDLPAICKVNTDASICPALLGQPVASPLPAGAPIDAPGPDAGAPDAGAPSGIVVDTPVVAPEASPVVTTVTGNNAVSSVLAPSATLFAALVAHLLF